ncbi:hypothetical protein AAZX31_04G144300 [Glycine max]|uniref:Uncharacterized protein n=4 Tax=Glycine subgen. Soja TaxID=1462606 RepID=K7KKD7_SOYBN|nr:uncharacterized protein LOC114409640 isoform X2 [Glycine soja]KAG4392501.1 hypothetical protein GLYMA_04G157900v4 [Glycine max]KAG4392507.1 hypothetical protein GLYMA_04G157900v4 [Glycine max]KAG5049524.1 hypothetical protein JHK85_010627 [Glycine max]KAG5066614.1 hypothetical protein JHK86_010345 [Glycine max]KAH1111554.1 hypothetical protein GYH30_010089 [Glycine max]|eukprot:XP_006578511.1 uncharacterized protein LOC102665075 isoform X1 [Glycine max]
MSYVDFPGGVVRMEPPMLGVEEECHSNESGWTMYIGSPRDEDAQHCDDDDDNHSLEEDYYDYEAAAAQHCDVESDDSMASDASSGPSKSKEQVKKNNKYCSEKKVEKKNEIMAFANSMDKAPAAVQNGSKVKVNKNYRVGTRKL